MMLFCLLGGCASVAPWLPWSRSEPLVDGHRRLGAKIIPTAYELDLTIDPKAGRFSGRVRIDITLGAQTDRIQMHGGDLSLSSVAIETSSGLVGANVQRGVNGALILTTGTPVAAGKAAVQIAFSGELSDAPIGLYRVRDGGHWYAFTQFEPLAARTSFPCFDQPEFKTPYRLRLRVPKGMMALANSREIGRRLEFGKSVFEFAETRPLPTYLVAFAVGDFDLVEAPKDAIPGTPLRVVTTKGKGRLAGYALERAPVIHRALSEYFDAAHPFDKLDLVAVPNFAAGAMENVGLVMFRETLLLLDGERAPANRKLWSQSVIAHELAHMWFGNSVTMTWWDDLWLNEAFATWMGTRIVQQVDPTLRADLQRVAGTAYIMRLDAQASTRAVRQPIKHGGDIRNAFDGITYGKGAAILRMVEAWLGPEVFRAGVRAYLTKHAYGGATTRDLFEALEAASNKPVGETIRLFLEQPGTPLVSMAISCQADKRATLRLSQTRALPISSTAPPGQPWSVPVCVRYGIGEQTHRQCLLFEGAQADLELEQPGCPTWFHGNAHQRGYYQWVIEGDYLRRLTGDAYAQLSPAERAALPGMLLTLLESERVDLATYMNSLTALAEQTEQVVLQGVVNGIRRLHHVAVRHETRDAFAAWVRALLSRHVNRIGFAPRADESVDDKLLRSSLVLPLAYMGQDEGLRSRAKSLTEQFLKQPDSVSPEVLAQVLPATAWDGDLEFWTRLKAALKRTTDPVTRVAIIGGLGSFEDPAILERSLDLVLSGDLKAQDFRSLGRGIDDRTRDRAWMWMTRNYDALVGIMGDDYRPFLPWMGNGFCTAADRERVERFFSPKARSPKGTDRNLSLVTENISRCSRLRDSVRTQLAAWLKAQ